jgi:hypothetical protein
VKDILCVHGKTGRKDEVTNVYRTSVIYHDGAPAMNEEIKITLPLILTPKHHILFVFSHISCKNALLESSQREKDNLTDDVGIVSNDGIKNVLGYSILPIRSVEEILGWEEKSEKFILLPLVHVLNKGYLDNVSEKSVDKKSVFRLQIRTWSLFIPRNKVIFNHLKLSNKFRGNSNNNNSVKIPTGLTKIDKDGESKQKGKEKQSQLMWRLINKKLNPTVIAPSQLIPIINIDFPSLEKQINNPNYLPSSSSALSHSLATTSGQQQLNSEIPYDPQLDFHVFFINLAKIIIKRFIHSSGGLSLNACLTSSSPDSFQATNGPDPHRQFILYDFFILLHYIKIQCENSTASDVTNVFLEEEMCIDDSDYEVINSLSHISRPVLNMTGPEPVEELPPFVASDTLVIKPPLPQYLIRPVNLSSVISIERLLEKVGADTLSSVLISLLVDNNKEVCKGDTVIQSIPLLGNGGVVVHHTQYYDLHYVILHTWTYCLLYTSLQQIIRRAEMGVRDKWRLCGKQPVWDKVRDRNKNQYNDALKTYEMSVKMFVLNKIMFMIQDVQNAYNQKEPRKLLKKFGSLNRSPSPINISINPPQPYPQFSRSNITPQPSKSTITSQLSNSSLKQKVSQIPPIKIPSDLNPSGVPNMSSSKSMRTGVPMLKLPQDSSSDFCGPSAGPPPSSPSSATRLCLGGGGGNFHSKLLGTSVESKISISAVNKLQSPHIPLLKLPFESDSKITIPASKAQSARVPSLRAFYEQDSKIPSSINPNQKSPRGPLYKLSSGDQDLKMIPKIMFDQNKIEEDDDCLDVFLPILESWYEGALLLYHSTLFPKTLLWKELLNRRSISTMVYSHTILQTFLSSPSLPFQSIYSPRGNLDSQKETLPFVPQLPQMLESTDVLTNSSFLFGLVIKSMILHSLKMNSLSNPQTRDTRFADVFYLLLRAFISLFSVCCIVSSSDIVSIGIASFSDFFCHLWSICDRGRVNELLIHFLIVFNPPFYLSAPALQIRAHVSQFLLSFWEHVTKNENWLTVSILSGCTKKRRRGKGDMRKYEYLLPHLFVQSLFDIQLHIRDIMLEFKRHFGEKNKKGSNPGESQAIQNVKDKLRMDTGSFSPRGGYYGCPVSPVPETVSPSPSSCGFVPLTPSSTFHQSTLTPRGWIISPPKKSPSPKEFQEENREGSTSGIDQSVLTQHARCVVGLRPSVDVNLDDPIFDSVKQFVYEASENTKWNQKGCISLPFRVIRNFLTNLDGDGRFSSSHIALTTIAELHFIFILRMLEVFPAMSDVWVAHSDERIDGLLVCSWLFRNADVNVIRSFFTLLPVSLQPDFLKLMLAILLTFQVDNICRYFKESSSSLPPLSVTSRGSDSSRFKKSLSVGTLTSYLFKTPNDFIKYMKRPNTPVLSSKPGVTLYSIYSQLGLSSFSSPLPFPEMVGGAVFFPASSSVKIKTPSSNSESFLLRQACDICHLVSLTLCLTLKEYIIVVSHPTFARLKIFVSPPAQLGEQTALNALMDYYVKNPTEEGWQRWVLLKHFKALSEIPIAPQEKNKMYHKNKLIHSNFTNIQDLRGLNVTGLDIITKSPMMDLTTVR